MDWTTILVFFTYLVVQLVSAVEDEEKPKYSPLGGRYRAPVEEYKGEDEEKPKYSPLGVEDEEKPKYSPLGGRYRPPVEEYKVPPSFTMKPTMTAKPSTSTPYKEPDPYKNVPRYEVVPSDTEEDVTDEKETDPYDDSTLDALNQHYCPPCLVWKKCGHPCEQECHPKSKSCRCKPGCFCPGNLKLNNDGQCVSPNLCPKIKHKTCCYGTRYTTCGSECAQSCGAEVCTLECKEGCFCLRGTKSIEGICQPPYKCRKCSSGKEYQRCGKRCDEICGCLSHHYPPGFCEEGCFCPKGKKIINGVCRPENECHMSHGFPFYKK